MKNLRTVLVEIDNMTLFAWDSSNLCLLPHVSFHGNFGYHSLSKVSYEETTWPGCPGDRLQET